MPTLFLLIVIIVPFTHLSLAPWAVLPPLFSAVSVDSIERVFFLLKKIKQVFKKEEILMFIGGF
jgi:hypothetical protein